MSTIGWEGDGNEYLTTLSIMNNNNNAGRLIDEEEMATGIVSILYLKHSQARGRGEERKW